MNKHLSPHNKYHVSRFNRRALLRMTGASLTLFASTAAGFAQTASSARRDWDDLFDVHATGGNQVETSQPVLSLATLGYTQMAIDVYRDIVSRGGWPLVPPPATPLRLGAVNSVVENLRQRLFISGDLARTAGISPSFDSYVDAAVRRFQTRHGLESDGVMGDATFKALNISAEDRLHQLEINLNRLNEAVQKAADEPRFVMVNIPAAQIEAVEEGAVFQKYTAVVGKTDRQTPILDSKIHEIILNPFWTVPRSIVLKDIIPLMRKNPDYLSDNNIHLFNGRGEQVAPQAVDWNTDEAAKLMFRQDPGKINAMSSTKINFHNKHAVYMHDTPQQGLFNNLMRFDSSGCIRVHNIRELNLWLLKNTTGWDRALMDEVIRSRESTPIAISDPVPLHFVYISGWSNGDGVVQFRDDIYQFDDLQKIAFDAG